MGVSCNFCDEFQTMLSQWCDSLLKGVLGKIVKNERKSFCHCKVVQNQPSQSGWWADWFRSDLYDRDMAIEGYIYLINNLLKMHLHSTALHIFVFIRAVNQYWELFRSDLLSSVSKHKEHWIYHVGLPTSIWTNDAWKTLKQKHTHKGWGK